ncbi:hypothetical protein CMI46_01295 [Candidatus Pacearchaeota archaeon]|nr:hypothetical protein [Candidatus Pacearchaeota archaeon]|tara:strand:+ start:16605 stop:17762 length:1158 start_codon:yes stop_codon:yes gene_type:complete
MKICLIYDFLTELGGLEREMFSHAKMLKEEGYEVEILTCYYDPKILEKLDYTGIKIKNISSIIIQNEFLSLALCFLGFTNLKNINPNFFLSYSFPSNFLLRNKKIPRINFMNHYPHFLYLNEKDKAEWASGTKGIKRHIIRIISWFLGSWLKKLDKIYVENSILNFGNSEFTKKRLDNIYNIDSKVSYPPLNEIFKPPKEKLNKKFIFGSGRVIPDKRYDLLINACSLMKNKIHLLISGQGDNSYKNTLLNLANKKNVNLKFVGMLSTDDLIRHYSSAEVFVFSTPKEDFGLVPAESLACGTPVVTWGDGAGPTEQIIDGKNGFLATPYDLNNFAEKIDLAINKKLKKRNHNYILNSSKKFSYLTTKQNFINEINNAINRELKND